MVERRDLFKFSPPDREPEELNRLRVLVFGLGSFGGGAGVARFLAERGAEVSITDLRTEDELSEGLSQLKDVPIAKLRLGGHDANEFEECDWLVVNPAVPPGNALLQLAGRRGARLVSEIGLFLSWCPSPHVAGITGSNGKSSTCQLLTDLLRAADFTTHLGGNFGGSLLGALPTLKKSDRVVLELSSFQLARLGDGVPRPPAVGITHIAPNHLDWHESFDAYRKAKEQLLLAAPTALPDSLKVAAVPRHDPSLQDLAQRGERRLVLCGSDDPKGSGIGVRDGHLISVESDGGIEKISSLAKVSAFPRGGVHEIENAAVASALGLALGAPSHLIESTIASQKSLPHRQEEIAEVAGIRFIDDSKATTPEAAIAAVSAVAPHAVLLAGGHHKGGDLTRLAHTIRDGNIHVICYGEAREKFSRAFEDSGVNPAKIELAERLGSAFEKAIETAEPGDAVLLSPACASFDEFKNYRERSSSFRNMIEQLQNDRDSELNASK